MTQEAISELNIEDFSALLQYLQQRGLVDALEQPEIRKLEGGVSNRVVLVKPENSLPFVLKQALEKLRVQVDWFCTPTRIEREALALRHLSDLAPPGSVPALIFEDAKYHLLAMAEVPEPHQNWKELLLSGNLLLDHIEQFGLILGFIHNRSYRSDLELLRLFADRSIFETLRLEPYYRYTARQLPESAGFLNQLITDTLACRICLVHGDYSPKNILVHDGRLVLLDCEVMHFGDPAFDIGFSMAHLLSKAHHLPAMRMAFAEAAARYWQTYVSSATTESWISELEGRAVRHTLGCCLARVAGRSPLEYLSAAERSVQAEVVLALLNTPPTTMSELVSEFVRRLPCRSSNA
jgi:tRNA A-37 threonylcarbamoyl transferase component Bud32